MKINYIIIDDEPISHKLIENFAKDISFMNLVGNCYTAIDALSILSSQSVDLIFLDINMPKITGFEFLKTLKKQLQVIIVSAHKEYALESYEYNITDYLLKPFNFDRFFKSIQKVVDNNSITDAVSEQHIFIKDEKKHHKVKLSEIKYIEASGNYAIVYLQKGQIISQMKISDFEKLLPSDDFSRIHRSYIVSHHKITLVSASEIKLEETVLPVGRSYKPNLESILKKK